MNSNFSTMRFEEKGWTINMLVVTVWLDGQGVEVTGGIPLVHFVLLPNKFPSPMERGINGVRLQRS
jgi:hypothetical protein